MTFRKRNKARIQQNIIDNLTLRRLEADLFAVEAAIRENEPTIANDEGGRIKKFINGIINDINNIAKKYTTRELSVDREKAKNALSDFKAAHSPKEFEISEDVDRFRKYIDKKLFKKDKNGIDKMSFALIFALNEKDVEYQCPEESLEVVSEILFDNSKILGKLYSCYRANYESLHKAWPGQIEGIRGLCSIAAVALLPVQITGLFSLISYALYKKGAKDAFSAMSAGEANATLAFYLTIIEHMRDCDERLKKNMTDELLKKVANIRSDAEYRWYVEGENISEQKKKIELCDLALARLGKILGI